MTRSSAAAALRRYRGEWRAAIARRDFAKSREILDSAMSAIQRETADGLDVDTRALNEMLSLDRRARAILSGEAPARFPAVRAAFEAAATRRFLAPWNDAVQRGAFDEALQVLGAAITAISRHFASRAEAQQALIDRLKRLQRLPLTFSPAPARCAFCGGDSLPGVDSTRLFICTDCVIQAHQLVAESTKPGRKAT